MFMLHLRDMKTPILEEEIAEKILRLARDHILMHMRFLDVALSRIKTAPEQDTERIACDGKTLRYDTLFLIRAYRREQSYAVRAYLHVLLHMVFAHAFCYERLDKELWDLAADMAVEQTVSELSLPDSECRADKERQKALEKLKGEGVRLTAENIYRHFRRYPPEFDEFERLKRLFYMDDHRIWKTAAKQLTVSFAEWKKLSERLRADLKSFSKGKQDSQSLLENLAEAVKDKTDYAAFLKRFVVSGEVLRINDEEFDTVYYTYGLTHYGNMPFVEPLEYQEVEKVRDFVIALDTSASCRGETVKTFLRKTYAIMRTAGAFFEDMNVHIIQCDNTVQNDTLIRSQDDFEQFLEQGKLNGFGATDFRPVFRYVERLIRQGTLTNLKGLIYFTDGYGTFPESVPDYETVFVYLNEDAGRPQTPPWAVSIILDGEAEDEY